MRTLKIKSGVVLQCLAKVRIVGRAALRIAGPLALFAACSSEATLSSLPGKPNADVCPCDAPLPPIVDARVDVITSASKDAGKNGSIPDIGVPDASFLDSGLTDIGIPNQDQHDTNLPDSGLADARVPDLGLDEGMTTDAGLRDAAIADVNLPDSGSPDSGSISPCDDGDPAVSLQINWLKSHIGVFGLVESYEGDGTNRAYTYDQALGIIAFTEAGELCEAQQMIGALASLQNASGSWNTCYLAEDGSVCESFIHTGPIAWVVMALNYFENRTDDFSHSDVARLALSWMDTMRETNPALETYGALKFGEGYPATMISTEHNLDAYSAYFQRGDLEGNADDTTKAILIQDYLLSEMWGLSPSSNGPYDVGVFWRGWADFAWCTDPQSWGVLALGATGVGGEPLADALEWLTTYGYGFGSTRNEQDFDGLTVDGFSFCTEDVNPPNGVNPNFCGTLFVWGEGTEQVATAHYEAGDVFTGDYFHDQILQTVSASGGVPYSFSTADLSWPCNWPYESVASTSWYYFNEVGVNPFRP